MTDMVERANLLLRYVFACFLLHFWHWVGRGNKIEDNQYTTCRWTTIHVL